MRLKLDENLGRAVAAALVAAGIEDVSTVPAQGLCGATDAELYDVCAREGRVLVTLDLDFANPLRFDSAGKPGIAVLRVRDHPNRGELVAAAVTLARHLALRPIAGRLWIVQPGRVRQYTDE